MPLDHQTQAQLNQQGLMLATQFLMLTEAAGKTGTNSTFLRPLMSPAYQIVRADGSIETPVRARVGFMPAACQPQQHGAPRLDRPSLQQEPARARGVRASRSSAGRPALIALSFTAARHAQEPAAPPRYKQK